MSRRLLISTVLLLLLPLSAFAQEKRPQARSSVERLKSELHVLEAIEQDEMDGGIPDTAREHLPQAKRALLSSIQEILNRQPDAPAEQLKAAVLDELRENEIQTEAPESHPSGASESDLVHPYSLSGITVETPTGLPDLLAITTTFSISCGNDVSLYLFRRGSTKSWQPFVVIEANGYKLAIGAQEGLQYRISTLPDQHGFYVLTASWSPWCTSRWQAMRVRIQEWGSSLPTKDAFDKTYSYILEDPPALKAKPGLARVDFQTGHVSVTEPMTRPESLLLERRPQGWRRIQPVADTAGGFLDVWLNADWSQAKAWVAANGSNTQHWHDLIHQRRVSTDSEAYVTQEIFLDKACSRRQLRVVGVNFSQDAEIPSSLFFVVRQSPGHVFEVEDVYSTPPNFCPAGEPDERQ